LTRGVATWLFFVGASSACTSQLASNLDGKECDAELRCVSGFVCDGQHNRCVRPGEMSVLDGSSGAGAVESPGEDLAVGHDEGPRVMSGDGAAPGAKAAGGAGGTELAASARDGGAPPDAAQAAVGGATTSDAGMAACTPQLLYPDADGDGVGSTSGAELRCAVPDWVGTPGDCRDDLSDVFLGQSRYFSVSYPEPTHTDGISFDFDCDGTEVPDPTNLTLAPVPNCAGLSVTCNERGYLPVASGRNGPGIEPRCGSNLLRQCVPSQLLGCVAEDLILAEDARFRCR